jgi:hypothetical protein
VVIMTTSLVPQPRTLHLVDLENLLGDPRAEGRTALHALDVYLELAAWRDGDVVVLATNPALMLTIAFALPVPMNTHTACGRDGADLALLSHAPPEWIAKRFDRLVIGSGDGIFAARARAAQERGVAVRVVARRGGCSKRLRSFPCVDMPSVAADVVLAA